MTTTTATRQEWGVRTASSTDRKTHIDVRADETDARRWHRALTFTGNRDATVVTRAPGGAWEPAPVLSGREVVALYGTAIGLTHDAMAHNLGVSARTIRRTIVSATQALGAVSPCHAAILAVLHGHIELAVVEARRLPPWPEPVPLRVVREDRRAVRAVMVDA